MWLHSEIVPGVNGSIKGRGVNLRHLTTTQRVALAASARMGKLNVCDLSAPQASTLFGVPVVDVDREIARRRSSELSDAAAYFASVWLATDPAARAEAIRSIGVDLFRAALAEVIT
jgi:hypothetical protein